jgi:vacuolar-type H+-ATPase subunit E/Vma4
MGLSDKFKDLKGRAEVTAEELKAKAQASAAEHSEQIHAAVEKVATTADQKTGGKYSDKIQQAGSKADGLVSDFAGSSADTEASEEQQPGPAA